MSEIITTIIANNAAATPEAINAAREVKSAERSKEQKLLVIGAEIAKLVAKYDDVANDREPQPKAKAAQYVPAVGDKVLATVGRNTATSVARVVPGTVTAVKFPEEGTKGATQVRVRIFEGSFEEQLVTLYPAQLVKDQGEAANA